MANETKSGIGESVKVEDLKKSKLFSKLTREIIKEANELSILTGAHIELFISSTSNKDDRAFIRQSFKNNKQSLAKQLLLLEEEVEKETKRGEMLKQKMEEQKRKYWRANPIETLDLNQLMELQRMYVALRDTINKELEKRKNEVPNMKDVSIDVTIQYRSNKFLSANGEASSTASTHDSVNPGIDVGGVMKGEGSSMFDDANATGASKMKAIIDG